MKLSKPVAPCPQVFPPDGVVELMARLNQARESHNKAAADKALCEFKPHVRELMWHVAAGTVYRERAKQILQEIFGEPVPI
jgi:hypothetical protein